MLDFHRILAGRQITDFVLAVRGSLDLRANPVVGLLMTNQPHDERGELPEGATHQIVGHDAEGVPIVKRRRFSLSD